MDIRISRSVVYAILTQGIDCYKICSNIIYQTLHSLHLKCFLKSQRNKATLKLKDLSVISRTN